MSEIIQHQGTITGSVTIQRTEAWNNCYFCMTNTYTRFELFEMPVCIDCKNKLLIRIKLIMRLE